MGRNRKKKNQQLPKHVYFSKGRYIYRPYLGNGRSGKEIVLANSDAPLSKIYREHEKLQESPTYTLKWLLYAYLESPQFLERSQRTQKDYQIYSDKLINTALKNKKNFGDVRLIHITAKTIRRYLDSYPAKVAANRHIQFLKAVFNWGRERYDEVTDNPCLGVRLHSEKPRERYIEDEEYELVRGIAEVSGTPYVVIFMELAYLCRGRWGEVANLGDPNILDEGIHLVRSKGSDDEVTTWTPRLRAAVSMAMAFNPNVASAYLIHDKYGQRMNKSAFNSAWQRIMVKALQAGLKKKYPFHDLKAKGISDHRTHHSGHRSMKMQQVYMRKLVKVESTR